jgi:cell wall-associated NlpC family hydrolase
MCMNSHTSHPILNEARSWLGVPFVHQGRTRHGVDCLGLLMQIAKELQLYDREGNLFSHHDCCTYSTTPCPQELYTALERACVCVNLSICSIQSTDIGLFTIEGRAQHLGIFAHADDGVSLHLIHAYQPAGRVVEHQYDAAWKRRLHSVFRL